MSDSTKTKRIGSVSLLRNTIRDWPAMKQEIEQIFLKLRDFSFEALKSKIQPRQRFVVTINDEKVGEIEVEDVVKGKNKLLNQTIGKIAAEIKKQDSSKSFEEIVAEHGKNEIATRIKCKLIFSDPRFGNKSHNIELLKLAVPQETKTDADTIGDIFLSSLDFIINGDAVDDIDIKPIITKAKSLHKHRNDISDCKLSSSHSLLPRHIACLRGTVNEINLTLEPISGDYKARRNLLLNTCEYLSEFSFSKISALIKPGDTLKVFITDQKSKIANQLGIFTVRKIHGGRTAPSKVILDDMLTTPTCKGTDKLIVMHAERELGTKISGELKFSPGTPFEGEVMRVILLKLLNPEELMRCMEIADGISTDFSILGCQVLADAILPAKYFEYISTIDKKSRLHLLPLSIFPNKSINRIVQDVFSSLQFESEEVFDKLLPNDMELNLKIGDGKINIGKAVIKDVTSSRENLTTQEETEIIRQSTIGNIIQNEDIARAINTMVPHKIATELTCNVIFNENAPPSLAGEICRVEILALELSEISVLNISLDKKTINNCRLSFNNLDLTDEQIAELRNLDPLLNNIQLEIIS